MKREILFKGKSVNTGEWLKSMTIAKGTIKRKMYNVFLEVDPEWNKGYEVINEKLNKNENRIF